jgi:hydroxyacylglutathione hydrolase
VSTIGIQRKYNYALQPMSREEFIKIVTADQPEAPDYFTYDAILNTKERLTLMKTVRKALKPLSLGKVINLREEGAQILDVREPVEFEGAHLEGSINIPLDGKYATWAGTILRSDIPVVIIADTGREEEAIMRLGRIGFDNIKGYLEGGMHSFLSRPDLLKRTDRITAPTLHEQLSSQTPPLVLDVRANSEWEENRIQGSVNIPLNQLEDRVVEIDRDRKMVVHCETGYRSSIASSILEKNGFANIADLVGGISAWESARLGTAK